MADADNVDCNKVVEELFTFLDGELTASRRVQITKHLDGCPPCHEVVDFHAELKITISNKCREVAPDHLRQRIAEALGLGGQSGITGRERGLGTS